MATLQKIRNRAGLLIAIIGVAMLAFILGDFIKPGNRKLGRSKMMVAKIDGNSVHYKEYMAIEKSVNDFYQLYYGMSTLNEQASLQAKSQAWNDLLESYILKDEFSKIGLGVPERELFDQVTGNNPHQLIRNMFANQETNTIDRSRLMQFLQVVQMDELPTDVDPRQAQQFEDQKRFWLHIEELIEKDRAKAKFNNLFTKGLYVTDFEAKNFYIENYSRVNFSYLVKPFSSIPDSLVKLNSSDIEKHYKNNISDYKNEEETRSIEYVTFEIVPTAEDDKVAKEEINNIKPEFATIKDDQNYVNINSHTEYDPKNYTKDQLPEIYRDELFDAKKGTIFGPYVENNAYKLAKLSKVSYLPDSVRARHILIAVNQEKPYNASKVIADSLMDLVKNGGNFSQLAESNSDDQTSGMVGGDLDWFKEGQMVKPFSDTCFAGKKGDIKMVQSQFGFHIVEILNQSPKVKKVQIGVIERQVLPGSNTIDDVYRNAMRFAGENNTYETFKAEVESNPALVARKATVKKSDMTLYNMPNSRTLVQWAFTNEAGAVSDKVFEINNSYIITAVKEINEVGNIPLEKVKELVKLDLIKKKKSEIIEDQLKAVLSADSDLETIANETNAKVIDAGEMAFANKAPMLDNGALEPKVLSAATLSENGSLVGPVVGNNGVYIVRSNEITKAKEASSSDLFFSKLQIKNGSRSRMNAVSAIKEKADIKDNRVNFF